MTLSDSATAQLWETFRASGGAGLIREAVELVLQELIEAEAAEAIGAGRYERSDTRVTERNGHRPRLLSTQAGDVELKIPKAEGSHGGDDPLDVAAGYCLDAVEATIAASGQRGRVEDLVCVPRRHGVAGWLPRPARGSSR